MSSGLSNPFCKPLLLGGITGTLTHHGGSQTDGDILLHSLGVDIHALTPTLVLLHHLQQLLLLVQVVVLHHLLLLSRPRPARQAQRDVVSQRTQQPYRL